MATIDELAVLSDEDPIRYESRLIVYFIFADNVAPIILTTRHVAEKKELIEWFRKAKEDERIRIIVVWPGQYSSSAFVCDPKIALKAFEKK